MLGKAEWFTYRSMGWGIAPRTWQGWVYVGAFIALVVTLTQLPLPEPVKVRLVWLVTGLFVVDCLIIWTQLGRQHDERERLHQLIIERNCSFAAVASVVVVMGFQIVRHRGQAPGELPFDPLLLVILGAMVLTKLVSTLYLRFRM